MLGIPGCVQEETIIIKRRSMPKNVLKRLEAAVCGKVVKTEKEDGEDEEYDRRSMASSVSWYMLKETDPKKLPLPVCVLLIN